MIAEAYLIHALQSSGALLEVYYEKLNYEAMTESPAYGVSKPTVLLPSISS